jgi:hypothetical protein
MFDILADNWDLDEFFERFTSEMIYLSRSDDLSSLSVDDTEDDTSSWISSPVVDCNFKNQPS